MVTVSRLSVWGKGEKIARREKGKGPEGLLTGYKTATLGIYDNCFFGGGEGESTT